MEHRIKEIFNVGTRKSELALIQTHHIIDELMKLNSEIEFVIMAKETLGDKIIDKKLSEIGGTALFTKDLETALAEKKVDLLVHSLKDLPTQMEDGMAIGAIHKRDSKYDAVIYHPNCKVNKLSKLPEDSVIGTSSLRRVAQLRRLYPWLKSECIRGNLNTRLKKLDEDCKYDALLLAEAGIVRMKWQSRIGEIINNDEAMYAVGQGALGIEVRKEDKRTIRLVSQLTDYDTLICCIAERAFINELEGGYSLPIGVSTSLIAEKLKICGAVYSLDGTTRIYHSCDTVIKTPADSDEFEITDFSVVVKSTWLDAANAADRLGRVLGNVLKSHGADHILTTTKNEMKIKKTIPAR